MDQKVTETTTNTTPTQEVQTIETTHTSNVQAVHPGNRYQKYKVIFRMHKIIWFIVGLLEILLAFRVVLKALGANPNSGFVDLIYALSDPLASPFAGIFGITSTSGLVFEWSTLVAGLVYLIIGYGLVKLMQLIKPANPQEVMQTVNNQ